MSSISAFCPSLPRFSPSLFPPLVYVWVFDMTIFFIRSLISTPLTTLTPLFLPLSLFLLSLFYFLFSHPNLYALFLFYFFLPPGSFNYFVQFLPCPLSFVCPNESVFFYYFLFYWSACSFFRCIYLLLPPFLFPSESFFQIFRKGRDINFFMQFISAIPALGYVRILSWFLVSDRLVYIRMNIFRQPKHVFIFKFLYPRFKSQPLTQPLFQPDPFAECVSRSINREIRPSYCESNPTHGFKLHV